MGHGRELESRLTTFKLASRKVTTGRAAFAFCSRAAVTRWGLPLGTLTGGSLGTWWGEGLERISGDRVDVEREWPETATHSPPGTMETQGHVPITQAVAEFHHGTRQGSCGQERGHTGPEVTAQRWEPERRGRALSPPPCNQRAQKTRQSPIQKRSRKTHASSWASSEPQLAAPGCPRVPDASPCPQGLVNDNHTGRKRPDRNFELGEIYGKEAFVFKQKLQNELAW